MNTLEEDSNTTFDNEELKKKRYYGFPQSVRYVAWFIVVAVIVSSSAALIMYGMMFGMVETYLWITTFLSFFFISLISISPFRIFALVVIDSIFVQKKPILMKRKVLPSLFSNPPNPVKKKKLLKCRHYNANLYNPMPFYKCQSRLEVIKYNLELQNLTADIFFYLIFIAVTLYTILINKPSMGFYSNELISELILKKTHKDSISFKEITTYEMLVKYMNDTLLPALLPNSMDGVSEKNPDKIFRRRKRTRNDYIEESFKKEHFLDEFHILPADLQEGEDNFDRGWTLNPNVKLMGIPRLRQIRVKTETCKELMNLKSRNIECAAELTLFNEETGDFSLRWGPAPSKGLTESQASPWRYQSAWKTATVPILAKFSTYPAGGFILELARNIDDARIVLQFLDTFQWVDARTRAIFIEFTIYCVNTNLFTVFTLIAEKSATGYIIPSYQIDTSMFLFPLEYMSVVISVLQALLLLFLLLRESLRIYRTSLKQYLSRALGVLDLAVIFLGVLSLIFVVLRNIYVSNLLEELEKADNNKFVSFTYASLWYAWSLYTEALLVCLIFIKLFRLLTLRVVFYQMQTTLSFCCKHFVQLVAKQIVLRIAFAFLLYLTFVNYFGAFRDFKTTLTTVIKRAVVLDDSFLMDTFSSSLWLLVPLFFGSFIILVSLLLVNVFTAIVCLYFQKIRNTALAEKYNMLEYIKHVLTISRQKDLFQKKEEKIFLKKTDDPDVMRLTGGGNKLLKFEKKEKIKGKKGRKEKRPKPGSEDKCEPMATTSENFLQKKPYDTTAFCDLTQSRAVALKNLMTSFLADDEDVRNVAKENAMSALFLSFVTDTTTLSRNSEKYFFVSDKDMKAEVYKKSTLSKIKKTIENTGKEKHWIVEEDVWEEEVAGGEGNLTVLKRKLSLLI